MFWVWTFHSLFLDKKNNPESKKQPWWGGRGGELLSDRKTSALAAHMNGIRGDPFHGAIVSGCCGQWATLGESRWQIMWCRELHAHWLRGAATLIIWTTFHGSEASWGPYSEVQAQTNTILLHYTLCLSRYHCLWVSPCSKCRNPLRYWKTWGVREKQDGGQIIGISWC